MRPAVGIADRGGDVVGLGHGAALAAAGLALQGSWRPGDAERGSRRARTRSRRDRATAAARARPCRARGHKRRARASRRGSSAAARLARDQRRDAGEEGGVALGWRPCATSARRERRAARIGRDRPRAIIARASASSAARSSDAPCKRAARRARRRCRTSSALFVARNQAASSSDVMASSSSGSNSSRRQRERIVGSSRPGAWLTRRKTVFGGRLLEHLEQRVGAPRLEIVDAVDHDRAPRRQRRWSRRAAGRARAPGRR